jgi:hypothetical protein
VEIEIQDETYYRRCPQAAVYELWQQQTEIGRLNAQIAKMELDQIRQEKEREMGYELLRNAVMEQLGEFVVNDDIAEECLMVTALESAAEELKRLRAGEQPLREAIAKNFPRYLDYWCPEKARPSTEELARALENASYDLEQYGKQEQQ